jgi:hypothetical protein
MRMGRPDDLGILSGRREKPMFLTLHWVVGLCSHQGVFDVDADGGYRWRREAGYGFSW